MARLNALVVIVLMPALAWPHGGEDHGEARPAAPVRADATDGVVYAETELFELLVKYPTTPSPEPITLRLFLSDYATNAPIEEAVIQLQFDRPESVTVEASPTSHAGIYEAEMTFAQPGSYDFLAIVTAAEGVDLMPLTDLEIAAEATDDEAEAGHGEVIAPWAWLGGGGLVSLLAFGVGVAVGRRRRVPRDEEEAT